MSIIENMSHPIISALAWSVLHSIWQFFVIMGLCFLALKLFSRSRAGIRHNLILLSFLAIPVTFIITFFRQYSVYTRARMIVSLEFENMLGSVSDPGSQLFLIDKNLPSFLKAFEIYTPWVFWLYLAGLVFFSVNGIFGYIKITSLRKRYVSVVPAEWKMKVGALSMKAGVRHVHAYLSERVDIPMVVGMIKPVVLLPVAMFTALSPEQIETVILHEFRHIRNKDHLMNMLQHIIEILFFYHPAIWWISKRLRAERENRIDEWVVATSGDPLLYAGALFSLEQNRSRTWQPVLAATQSKNLLLTRIKNIMTMKTRSFNPGKNLAALLTITAAAIMLAWIDPAMGLGYYQLNEPGQHVFYDNSLAYASPPAYVQEGPADQAPAETAGVKEPKNVHLNDGSIMKWDSLSEKEQDEILKALQGARIALSEANREIVEHFQSEEFRQQMKEAQEEIRQAMAQVNAELNTHFQSEEFRREMEEVREEIRKAMEEVNREIMDEVRSEEFRKEMEAAREEIRRAMEEVNHEIIQQFHSEEFQQEMREVGEELRKVFMELEEIDWETLGAELNSTMQVLGNSLEEIGPFVNETLKELQIDELIQEIMKAFEYVEEPVEQDAKEPAQQDTDKE